MSLLLVMEVVRNCCVNRPLGHIEAVKVFIHYDENLTRVIAWVIVVIIGRTNQLLLEDNLGQL